MFSTATPSYTLQVNGSVAGASAYVNLSDARLKKNIVHIDDALSLIGRLQGVRFEWRTTNERAVGKDIHLSVGDPQIGFVAQDVQRVIPEAVSIATDPDAIMSVAESKLTPILVEAVKQLKAANDNQHAEIAQLRAQQLTDAETLRTQLTALERRVTVRTT